MVRISPSILSADFANLARDIHAVQNADMLHLDVMDGHFVPNLTIGPVVTASIRKCTDLCLEAHLMISDPLSYVEAFARTGVDIICFHCEAVRDPGEVVDRILSCGKRAGIALRPSTPVSVLAPYLPKLSLALIMAVEPGFGGQAFQPAALTRLAQLRELADRYNPGLLLEVDGGVVPETGRLCAEAGANVLVAGTYVFSHTPPGEAVELLRLSAENARWPGRPRSGEAPFRAL